MQCTLVGAIILSIKIQEGLNMHKYDDIGDVSLSLRGPTSSFKVNQLFWGALFTEKMNH